MLALGQVVIALRIIVGLPTQTRHAARKAASVNGSLIQAQVRARKFNAGHGIQ